MRDQAERLRSLVSKGESGAVDGQAQKQTRIVSITSGKGGVGKTTIAVNLALAARRRGISTILFDADLGLGNIDVALGIYPPYNLMHVIRGEKNIDEIIFKGPGDLNVIAAGSGWTELANLPRQQLQGVISSLARLGDRAELIIFDTGAGLSRNVLSFLFASEEVIVVTTPEPTSITDAYAVIKQLGKQRNKRINIVVNRVDNEAAATAVYHKLADTAGRFLGIRPRMAGWLPEDVFAARAIMNQQSVLLAFPKSRLSLALEQLAQSLFGGRPVPVEQEADGLRLFFHRLARLLGGGGIY